jgi:hypothetical protein
MTLYFYIICHQHPPEVQGPCITIMSLTSTLVTMSMYSFFVICHQHSP